MADCPGAEMVTGGEGLSRLVAILKVAAKRGLAHA